MQTPKELYEKTVCYLMDRGISPQENIDAMKEVVKELEVGSNKESEE